MNSVLSVLDNTGIRIVNKDNTKELRISNVDSEDISYLNPRNNISDNITKMACFHPKYDLPNETNIENIDSYFNSWEDVYRHLIKEENAVIIRTLYLYDHSKLFIATSLSNLPQESYNTYDIFRIGYVYINKKNALKYLNKDTEGKITKKDREKLIGVIENELELYNYYISGQIYEVYIYDILDDGVEEFIDSCTGFYGSDLNKNGSLDFINNEYGGYFKELFLEDAKNK